MLISKTPLRVSFVGGGSDLKDYYYENGGAVISTSIDQYVYITINKKFDNQIRVAYSINEEVSSIDKLKHPLVLEAMKMCDVLNSVEITTVADIPAGGSGLGSSSSFTVGLCNILNAYKGKYSSPEELARMACEIEINKCKEPIGKQDQYAAAYGGLNKITFNNDETVDVAPISIPKSTLTEFQESLIFFYTGITRSASSILSEQKRSMSSDKKRSIMRSLVNLVPNFNSALENGNISDIGAVLHEGWELKQEVSSKISNDEISSWYSRSISAGAYGGKLLGAGGGGFLMICADPENHKKIINELDFLKPVNFKFSNQGSAIIFSDQ